MQTVKVLYVKNLKESVTEEKLQEMFVPYGEIEKVKKLRDYAFIHYKERDSALKVSSAYSSSINHPIIQAMEALKGTVLDDIEVDISLAKPQSDNKSKKKVTTKRGMGMPGVRGFGGKNFNSITCNIYFAGPGMNPRGRGGFGGPGNFGKPFGGPSGAYDSGYGNYGYQSGPPGAYYDPYAYGGYQDPYSQGFGGPPGAVSCNLRLQN
jgi:RNA recognition motif-containing protein